MVISESLKPLLENLGFQEHHDNLGLYLKRLEEKDSMGEIGVTAYIDFRKNDKGRRFYTVEGIEDLFDNEDDVNSIPVLQYFKTERDKILGADGEKPNKKRRETNLPASIGQDTNLTKDNIIQYLCPTATEAEAYNFLQLCLHRGLNPFLKEAYLIKYGNSPATMIVGKDAFTRKAEESGKLDGFEAGIIIKTKEGNIYRPQGTVQNEGDTLLGGWAKVYRKDMSHPFVEEVMLSEYIKYKDGKPMSSWATMPGTMIRKVALIHALREAFTSELGGCYERTELGIEERDNQ